MTSVQRWTGVEARALRLALRMSVRAFAEHLGVAVRTISKWEKLKAGIEPRPDTQAVLDTALRLADAAARLRFQANITAADSPALGSEHAPAAAGGGDRDHESWADDLDRAAVALSRQDFTFASTLLHRWLDGSPLRRLDERGAYLAARSAVLLGDLMRDRGILFGALSAQERYRQAGDLYVRLELPRRVGQVDLMLVLLDEMCGRHDVSVRAYEHLAEDGRLSRRDRARARLWLGRSLSKLGENESAVTVMTLAARDFEDLGEPWEWAVTQQKVALAHRGTGDLARALHHIELARSGGGNDSPLQQVRLSTALGHILLSDPATREAGVSGLRNAAELALHHGLGHQLRSIDGIRRAQGMPSAVLLPKEGGANNAGSSGGRPRAAGSDRRAVAGCPRPLGLPSDGARAEGVPRGDRARES